MWFIVWIISLLLPTWHFDPASMLQCSEVLKLVCDFHYCHLFWLPFKPFMYVNTCNIQPVLMLSELFNRQSSEGLQTSLSPYLFHLQGCVFQHSGAMLLVHMSLVSIFRPKHCVCLAFVYHTTRMLPTGYSPPRDGTIIVLIYKYEEASIR